MKIRLVVCLLLTQIGSLGAFAADLSRALIPTPISIALTIGQWLMKEERKTYYVQVESTADSVESARSEAFRLAVELAVGSLVVSETDVRNGVVARNEILKYSAGYIDNFKVLSETQIGGRTRLVVDVWVGESKIADRIQNRSRGQGSIEGSRIAAQQDSLKRSKDTAVSLLELVARDFPERAFSVAVGQTTSRVSANQVEIDVPIRMKWNSDYLNSLLEVIERTKDSEGRRSTHPFILFYRKEGSWTDRYVSYTEYEPGYVMHRHFIESEPMVRLRFMDVNKKTIGFNCRRLAALRGVFYSDAKMLVGHHSLDQATGQFFAAPDRMSHFGVYGDYEGTTTLRTTLTRSSDLVARMNDVEVDVVRKIECDAGDKSLESQIMVKRWCRTNRGNGKDFCPEDLR